MNPLIKIACYLISLPARMKGMTFGANSFIGPGYDFMFIDLRKIVLGNNVIIGKRAWLQVVSGEGSINIGDNTSIGRNVTITSKKSTIIGANCRLSYNVSIIDHNHQFANQGIAPANDALTEGASITIGDHCFIGAHSFILRGVTLGRHCVVGANSVVTKSFEDFSVVAGNPARLIKSLKS